MKLRLAFKRVHPGYGHSLIPTMLSAICGGKLEFTSEANADLVIVGPFKLRKLDVRWGRPFAKRPIRLFHTGENVRHNAVKADYAISFDLGVTQPNHLRWPLWLDGINWRESGVDYRPDNRRFGVGIELDQLMAPLGEVTLERPRRAALFTTHLKEPRPTLLAALREVMEVDGYGRVFDRSIGTHNTSRLLKKDLLANYRFNLCPENSLYPGYYTEKIMESYAAGCIPITWADDNLRVDFNPGAVINCLPFAGKGYASGIRQALSDDAIARMLNTPLLQHRPTLEPLRAFLEDVVTAAI